MCGCLCRLQLSPVTRAARCLPHFLSVKIHRSNKFVLEMQWMPAAAGVTTSGALLALLHLLPIFADYCSFVLLLVPLLLELGVCIRIGDMVNHGNISVHRCC